MKFKGTILITDPCYLDHNSGEDLWFESSCGEDLSVYGCSQWISESTIYGDWSCHTYKGLKEEVQQNIEEWNTHYMNFFRKYNAKGVSQEERDKLLAEYRAFSKEFKAEHTYGAFCADAGMVCVVYLDEVLKVNPGIQDLIDKCPHCVTIIEDFDGDIRYEVGDDDDAHIVGIGNKNFYTSQSGL